MKNIAVGIVLVVVFGLSAASCFFGDGSGGSQTNQTEQDITEYITECQDLDENRSELLGEEATEVSSTGDIFFWLQFNGYDPTLHSMDGISSTRIDYGFSIGSGDDYNYRASTAAVATAEPSGDQIVYRLYDASQSNQLLGEVGFESPQDEQKWWAYDVDGDSLYVVTTGEETGLFEYVPGGTATFVTSLESAGCQVAEFWDFAVDGNTMVFVESGRIWRLDLGANEARWLGNQTEISGPVFFDDDWVMFVSAEGPFFFDSLTEELTDLGAAIEQNPYRINETFASAHLYLQDLARFEDYMIYIGNYGVFAYDLAADVVVPILLSPHSSEIRIDYRYPVVSESGQLAVTGLTSTSGAVGADGPIYSVDLSQVLP